MCKNVITTLNVTNRWQCYKDAYGHFGRDIMALDFLILLKNYYNLFIYIFLKKGKTFKYVAVNNNHTLDYYVNEVRSSLASF